MEGEAVNRPLPHQLGLSQFIKHSLFLSALTFFESVQRNGCKKVFENRQKQKRMQQTEPLAFNKPKFREQDPMFKPQIIIKLKSLKCNLNCTLARVLSNRECKQMFGFQFLLRMTVTTRPSKQCVFCIYLDKSFDQSE